MTRARMSVITQAVYAIAHPHGVTVHHGVGGKHRWFSLTHPDGRWHKEPVAWSPRTRGHEVDWAEQATRRVLLSWGFELPHAEPRQRRPKDRVGGGWPRSAPETPTRLAADPWAVLASMRHGCAEDVG